MDTYQAVYDAVRSKISSFDGNYLSDRIIEKFDYSFQAERLFSQASEAISKSGAPSVLYRPKIFIDGNKWCALYGDNLQDGVSGFGDSPAQAMEDFNERFYEIIGIEK